MKIGMVIILVCIISQMVITAGEATVLSVKWWMHIKWQMVLHLAGAIRTKQQILTQTVILVFMPALITTELPGDNVPLMWRQVNPPIIFKREPMKNGMGLKKLLSPVLIRAKVSLKTGMEHIQVTLCVSSWIPLLMLKAINKRFPGVT